MIRVVIENVLLFLLPTAVYVSYMLLTRRASTAGAVMNEAPLIGLFVAGAALVVATLVYFGTVTSGGRPDQTYTPPHMKDGRIEPGNLK
jgi:hypothetical protein